MLIIPSICYFLLVSKMAVYILSRYLIPIYAVLIVWILCGIFIIGKRLLERKYWLVVSCLFLTLMTVDIWKTGVGYLYKDSMALLSDIENYSEYNCLYIYDVSWKVIESYCEISQYNSITFYNAGNIAAIANMEHIFDDDLVVYIVNTCDSMAVLEYIIEQCPLLNTYQEIGSYGYATSYYLYDNGAEAN